MVPSPEQCLLLLREYQVPENVIEHSRRVRAVALGLCRALNRSGEKVDPAQVEAASLLHDIAKVRNLSGGESHSQAGAVLLRALGYGEVAEIVRQHVVLDPESDLGRVSEAALVHYADKRVKHTRVVTLKERFRDLRERYGRTPESLAWLKDLERKALALEERIFRKISLSPKALERLFARP